LANAAVIRLDAAMLVCPKCGSVYTREVDHCGLDGARLIGTLDDPHLGRTLDRYRIEAPLGSGGMARVYRARHTYLEQDFAVKILHGEIAADKDLARRFHREAKALSRIKHANVVNIVDFGSTPEGLLFMVMEFLDGPTLSGVLHAAGPLPARRSAAIVRQVCLGLEAAHARGYVHRDLKPGNIALVEEGGQEVVKILDFGLVRIVEPDGDTEPLTQQGMFFGTPAYMSPEQVQGLEVSPASDLYALGVILYQMLTGSPPFTGDVKQLAHQHITTPPPRPPLEHGGLTEVAMNLLEKEPRRRPASALAVVQQIDGLSVAPTLSSIPAPSFTTPSKRPRKEPATRRERSVLAQPVIAEEREFLSSVGGADEEEMGPSIRAALGLRAYVKGWVPLAVVLMLGGAGVYYFSQGGELPALPGLAALLGRDAPGPAPTPDPPPAPAPEAPEVPKTQAPRPEAPPAKAPPAAKAPPPAVAAPPKAPPEPTPPRVATPPAAVTPPPPEPPEEVVEVKDYATKAEPAAPDPAAPPAKSFGELDINLGWAVNQKGLTWNDLAEAAPDAARQWQRWYKKSAQEPEPALVQSTFDALMDALDAMTVDRALLEKKLARCKKSVQKLGSSAGDPRFDNLKSRFADLARELGFEPLRREARTLAVDLSLLEADLRVMESEAAAPPTRTSTAG
jgi:serine/threonine protein kinase